VKDENPESEASVNSDGAKQTTSNDKRVSFHGYRALASHCLAMDVYSEFTILAFRHPSVGKAISHFYSGYIYCHVNHLNLKVCRHKLSAALKGF
jgi:hypothetical protein